MGKFTTTCMSMVLITGLCIQSSLAQSLTENLTQFHVTGYTVQAGEATFSGGTGTQEDPFQITTAADLSALSEAVKGGNPFAETYFIMTQDIDMTEVENMKPIGMAGLVFSGHFDGANHTVSNLTITSKSDMAVGLFGLIQNASIKNLTVSNSTIIGGAGVGAVVGITAGGPVNNCHAGEGTIVNATQTYAGGVVGGSLYAKSVTISNCTNKAEVKVDMTCGGGILGVCESPTILTNCVNFGKVMTGVEYAGGIIGYISESVTINDCANVGYVESYGLKAGGISSMPNDIPEKNEIVISLTDCYNSGEIRGASEEHTPIIIPSPIGQQMEINNCYYNQVLFTGTAEYGTSMTADDMKNGTLLKALNHDREPAVWYAAESVNNGMPVPFEIKGSSIDEAAYCEQPVISIADGKAVITEGYIVTNVLDMQGKAVRNEALQEGIYVVVYCADNNRTKPYSVKVSVQRDL